MARIQQRPDRADGDQTTPGFYDVVHRRRDVRAEFTGGPIDEAVLARVLGAAHSAPSVGLSQPWDFVLVTDDQIRRAFWEHVQQERSTFAASLEKERAERFAGIKVDGVLEASLSVVVTYDPARGAPGVLGRHAIADAGLYSVCLAIENMWLACTAEGWGMGWVSFYRESFLRQLLGIPQSIRPVAWLCLGPVTALQDTPDLERHGWRARVPLAEALHLDHWDRDDRDVLAVAATSRAVRADARAVSAASHTVGSSSGPAT
jgi:5,6-dimethylbenzimidazole synthase